MDSKIKNGFKTYTITATDGITQATFIPERGAVGSSIIMPGGRGPREILFQHPYFWDETIKDLPGGWPFLFPVCARLQRQDQNGVYLYDGQLYQLPIHGFSWNVPWELKTITQNQLIMQLEDDEKTINSYPFQFCIQLEYIVEPGLLICNFTCTNKSKIEMPYYAGFHPYFLTPKKGDGKELVILDYHPKRRLLYNENLTDIIGEGRLFSLPSPVTNPDLNEQLTIVEKNESRLTFPDGDQLMMQVSGEKPLFQYIQLYTIPEQPFFCVEPWMAFPNAMNSVSGVRWCPVGASDQARLELRLIKNEKLNNSE